MQEDNQTVRVVRGIRRKPTPLERIRLWVVLLFIGIAQLLAIPGILHRLSFDEETIREWKLEPALAISVARLEDDLRSDRHELIAAVIIGPIATALAYWKWSTDRLWARRFTLRTLLIGMALIAVVLRLVVWAASR